MTRYTPLWLQAGSYAASVDRRLVGALWPQPASSGCLVTANVGMTVQVAPGQVAVPSQNNTGSSLCSSDAGEVVGPLAAAPSSGTNRIDLIICRPRGNDLDGGSNNDFIFDFVTGNVAASPAVPATPAGTVALAQIYIPGGSASVSAGNITDVRPGGLAIPAVPAVPSGLFVARAKGPAAQTDVTVTTPVSLVTISQTLNPGRYRISGHGSGVCVTAAAAWVNSTLNATGSDVVNNYLFSLNTAQISVNGQIPGATFTVITLAAPTACTFSVAAATNVTGGSILRFIANCCELLVEQIA